MKPFRDSHCDSCYCSAHFFEFSQTCLGKQGKYLEAQTVKSHADHKELKELQATLDAYQSEVTLKERVLKAKQQSEMSILLQRAAQTRDELRKNKENDISCCIQVSFI